MKKSPENNGSKIKIIIGEYKSLYRKKFGLFPSVNYGLCSKLINRLLKDHSGMGIIKIIELYFEDPNNKVFHLPGILSAYSVNKYLPGIKLDPRLYSNAEEYNKEIY